MAIRQPFWKWHRWKSTSFYPYIQVLCYWSLDLIFKAKLKLESRKEKSNIATTWPVWEWHCWKSSGFFPRTQVMCYWSLDFIFKAKLKLQSGNKKIQYVHLAAILEVVSWKINRLLSIHTSNILLKFGLDIQSQTKVKSLETSQPFWRWHLCPWPQTTCTWNSKLKF